MVFFSLLICLLFSARLASPDLRGFDSSAEARTVPPPGIWSGPHLAQMLQVAAVANLGHCVCASTVPYTTLILRIVWSDRCSDTAGPELGGSAVLGALRRGTGRMGRGRGRGKSEGNLHSGLTVQDPSSHHTPSCPHAAWGEKPGGPTQ